MSNNKAREAAEAAFQRTQSQFFAKNKAIDELDHIAIARDEKTARLRQARLAKEEADRTSAAKALQLKRRKNTSQ